MIIPNNLFKPIEGVFKIRYSPNKRINLNTIDERARTIAMIVVYQKDFE